jgi:hypothetical protein
MKRKRYSVEQIVAAVKQHELGTPAADIARKLGIAEQTFYRDTVKGALIFVALNHDRPPWRSHITVIAQAHAGWWNHLIYLSRSLPQAAKFTSTRSQNLK